MRFALFRMLDNDSELYQRSANYANFGGATGFRRGYENSHLNRSYFTHPPLTRVHPFSNPSRSIPLRIVEVDDMEGQVHTSSVQHDTSNRDVQMPDIESSDGRCNSSTAKSNHPSVTENPRYPLTCHRCQYVNVGGTCMEPDRTPLIQGQHTNHQSNYEYVPYFPLPPIQELLNSPPETPQAQPAGRRRASDEEPNYIRFPAPGPSNSPVQSQFSTVSSDTIRANPKTPDDRYHLIINLYYTCVDASAKYINSLHPSSRRRDQQTSQGQSSRYHPYSAPHGRPSASRAAHDEAKPGREPSLMDNISKISTHIWRDARKNIMAPHRAEADAVRLMRDLYAWGEIIVRGMENGGDYEDEDDGRSSVAELSREDDGSVRIAGAARKFCGWLRDRDAWGVCDEMLAKLRDLDREGLPAGNGRRGGSLDTSSDGIR